jgi:hypothetical protein
VVKRLLNGRFSVIKLLGELTGVDPSPITSEAIEAAIKDLPRDPETIALYKHLADHRPTPTR